MEVFAMIRFTAFLLCASLATAAATASAQASSASDDDADPRLEVDTKLHVGPMVLVSFSAVAIAVGAGFGWEAKELHDDWKIARDAGDPSFEMDGLADDVHKYSITADVLMFGGAAFAIVGTVWWIVAAKRDKAERPERTVAFRPLLGPAQAGAVVEF
jgi:hypothetical protein